MKEIDVHELKQKLDNKEDIEIIDVRESYELEIATMGARHIPMGEAVERKSEIPENKPVVMHCRSGKRSAAVIDTLEKLYGYKNLYNLKGGILAWREIDPSLPAY